MIIFLLPLAGALRVPLFLSPFQCMRRQPSRVMAPLFMMAYERTDALEAALEAAKSEDARRASDMRATELRIQAKARADLTLTNDMAPELAIEAEAAAERAAAANAKKRSAFTATSVARQAGDERGARILESDALTALREEMEAVEDEIAMLQMNIDALKQPITRLRSALKSGKLTEAEEKQAQSELIAAEVDEQARQCVLDQRVAAFGALRQGEDEEAGGRQKAADEAAALRAVPRTDSEKSAALVQAAKAEEEERNKEAIARSFDAASANSGKSDPPELSTLTARELATEVRLFRPPPDPAPDPDPDPTKHRTQESARPLAADT